MIQGGGHTRSVGPEIITSVIKPPPGRSDPGRRENLVGPTRHPLLATIAQGAKWVGRDAYPAFPDSADEHEKWLQFARATGGGDLAVQARGLKTDGVKGPGASVAREDRHVWPS